MHMHEFLFTAVACLTALDTSHGHNYLYGYSEDTGVVSLLFCM